MLDWKAQINATYFYAGISVSPHDGSLDAGQSQTITVTNETILQLTGEIDFVPGGDNAGNAGVPAAVTYKTQCGGG